MSAHASGVGAADAGTWRWAVALVLISALIAVTGPQQVWRTLRQASAFWLLASTCLLVPWFLLGIVNVWLLLRRLTAVPFRTFARVYAASWTVALLLPGQLGDATQVFLLRRQGVPILASSAAYLTDKTLSLGFMLAVASLGVVLYGPVESSGLPVGFVMAGALLTLTAGSILVCLAVSKLGPANRARQALDAVTGGLVVFARNPWILVLNLVLTALKWLMMTASYACAFRAFRSPVSLAAAATIPVMSSLVGYLPISVGGLGTTEWTAVALFARLGVSEAAVLAAFLLLRTSVILIAILLFGARRAP